MTMKLGAVSLLTGCIFVSACTLNHAERRAATGGALGAGAGALGGYVMGYDPLSGALVGGAGGALLGALTTPDRGREAHHHQRHDYHGNKHHNYHGKNKRWRRDD
jgi:osmotically inducible lipoprotein OsmB